MTFSINFIITLFNNKFSFEIFRKAIYFVITDCIYMFRIWIYFLFCLHLIKLILIFTADETYIKIRGIKTYIWLIMNAATRSIIGYQVSDNRGVGPCILAMCMAFQGLTKLPESFKFIADGYSAYPLAAMEFVKKFGKDFTFKITQVIGLTNDDAVSTEHRPFKQMIERLNRTYKASYRHTNGFDNIDGANYDLTLWVAYYNFLRPHKHNKYKFLNEVDMLQGADNMPGKWQLLIFLGQQTILNMQKAGTISSERSCCQ